MWGNRVRKDDREVRRQYIDHLRHVAEFENFKRRNAKERMELIQTAGKDVITDLLDVLDADQLADAGLGARLAAGDRPEELGLGHTREARSEGRGSDEV